MNVQKPRVMIAGTGSGCGKTTVTCGLLGALMNTCGVSAFKCGPDYIDPMFHKKVLGVPSYNLDPFMMDEYTVRSVLGRYAREISVIEGVMGFYDGLGSGDDCSSCAVSTITATPVILVVNVKGMSFSAAAVVKGFAELRPNRIEGVILSGTSGAMYPMYKEMIERETRLQVCGYMPHIEEASLESRHLGLVTAGEVEGLKRKTQLLADAAKECLDLDAIKRIAGGAAPLEYRAPGIHKLQKPVRVAVAMDKAFCFYYESGLNVLRDMGAELVPFSPLADSRLPEDIGGLILGGGYPELYAGELNGSLLAEVKNAVQSGLPTVAECGGFMYLQQSLTDAGGKKFPAAGALAGEAYMTDKLNRFGYVTLRAERDNLLCNKGEEIKAHEFHYSDSTRCGDGFTAIKKNKSWRCTEATQSLFAGYPHINFSGNEAAAGRFLMKCSEWVEKKERKS